MILAAALVLGSLGVAEAAGSAELWLERGVVALDEGRLGDARACALSALDAGADWHGYRLHLDASARAGLLQQVGASYEALGATDPNAAFVWLWYRVETGSAPPELLAAIAAERPEQGALALAALAWKSQQYPMTASLAHPIGSPDAIGLEIRALLAMGEHDEAARLTKTSWTSFPDHPEIASGLWLGASPPGVVKKLRGRILAEARERLRTEDPIEVFRLRTLFLAAGDGDGAALAAERLVELGEERPRLDRARWSEDRQRQVGYALATLERPELPAMSADEVVEVARVSALSLEDQGRIELAIATVSEARAMADDRSLAELHARLLLSVDRHEQALAAANQALELAALPPPNDGSGLDARRMTSGLAAAHALRGAALQGLGRHYDALAAFTYAALLDPTQWADTRGRLRVEPVSARALEGALASALAEQDDARALSLIDEAERFMATRLVLDKPEHRAVAASLEAARGRALARGGDRRAALAAFTTAVFVTPEATVQVERARLLEQLDHRDAAFVAWSVAQAWGSDVASAIERTWPGPGAANAPRDAVLAAWRLAAPPPVSTDWGTIELGGPVPSFTVETPTGQVSPESLKGRIVVLAFWASWCGPCLTELPDIAMLARRLDAEGLPVTVLAVSIDARMADYERIRRRTNLEGIQFAWNPELGARFHVTTIPSTWVLDAQGIARFHHDGYASGGDRALEQEVRNLLP